MNVMKFSLEDARGMDIREHMGKKIPRETGK